MSLFQKYVIFCRSLQLAAEREAHFYEHEFCSDPCDEHCNPYFDSDEEDCVSFAGHGNIPDESETEGSSDSEAGDEGGPGAVGGGDDGEEEVVGAVGGPRGG